MTNIFTGRKSQQALLLNHLCSGQPELIAVWGRRRVGKTELIRHIQGRVPRSLFVEMTGQRKARLATQLGNFTTALSKATGLSLATPKSWREAFTTLETIIKNYSQAKPDQAVIVFLDEVPWFDSPRSEFLSSLEYFWNNMGSKIPQLKLVLCGSASSWIIKKILEDTGGWYGRVTVPVYVEPFSLVETEEFFNARGFRFSRRDIIQIYSR